MLKRLGVKKGIVYSKCHLCIKVSWLDPYTANLWDSLSVTVLNLILGFKEGEVKYEEKHWVGLGKSLHKFGVDGLRGRLKEIWGYNRLSRRTVDRRLIFVIPNVRVKKTNFLSNGFVSWRKWQDYGRHPTGRKGEFRKDI